MPLRNLQPPINSTFKNIAFFLHISAVTVLFLLCASFLMSAVEPGNEVCDGCSVCSEVTSNHLLRKYLSFPGFGEEHEQFDEDEFKDPFYDSPEVNFEHTEGDWSFTDGLYYTYGVMSTSGSNFLPITLKGFCITYLVFLAGIPLVYVLVGKMKDYLTALNRKVAKTIERTMFTPSSSNLRLSSKSHHCPENCYQCKYPYNFESVKHYKPSYEQATHPRFTRPRFFSRRTSQSTEDEVLEQTENCETREEEGRKTENETSEYELPIALLFCHAFWFTTSLIIRSPKSTIMDSLLMSVLWFLTAGSLEFRTSALFPNLLAMYWGFLGIAVFTVTLELLTKKAEEILWSLFGSIEKLFLDEDEVDNEEDFNPYNHVATNSHRVMYYDPYNG